MATKKAILEYYNNIYGKEFPSSTLSKWVKDNKVRATKQENGRYDYNLDDFINMINNQSYITQINAKKEKPENYIGKTKGYLFIKGIVPINKRNNQHYQGTVMYCDCLACGKKDVQVRFTYLSDNGNYNQNTCGCGRKIRAFLASVGRSQITEDYLMQFNNFEKFLFVHKLLTHITDNHYGTHCDINEYKEAVE